MQSSLAIRPEQSATRRVASATAAQVTAREVAVATAVARADAQDSRAPGRAAPRLAAASSGLTAGPDLSSLRADIDAVIASAGLVRGDIAEAFEPGFALAKVHRSSCLALPADARTMVKKPVSCTAQAVRNGDEASLRAATENVREVANLVIAQGGKGNDVMALVQWVMRESYIENTEDLYHFAEKVKFFNEQKRAVRDHISELNQLRAQLAGVSEEEAATTRLNGEATPESGNGAGSAAAPGGAGGEPLIDDAAQRNRDYPDQSVAVAEFTPFDGAGELENYLVASPDAQGRLLDAIPFMTSAELRRVLFSLGGTDGDVAEALVPFLNDLANAMTDGQLLDLLANPIIRAAENPWVPAVFFNGGDLGGPMIAAVSQAKARVERELGRTYTDPQELISAWRAHRSSAIDAAQRASGDYVDESVGTAIAALNIANPDGPITTADIAALAGAATDVDGAVGTELADLEAFVQANDARLTPGARAAFDLYRSLAQGRDNQGQEWLGIALEGQMIPALMIQLEQLSARNADQDAAATLEWQQRSPQGSETDSNATSEPPPAPTASLDIDPSDGSIDAVVRVDQPPYLRASGEKIETVAQLDAEIKKLEEDLNQIGDDAQLANVDLQNNLQKQQQTLQTLSNVSKTMNDLAMAIIRNMV